MRDLQFISKTCGDTTHAKSEVGTFQEGDLVLRLVQNKEGMHKLSPPWEGPFVISKNLHNGSYYLVDVREPASGSKGADTAHTLDPYAEAKRPWNIAQLRPYYS